MLVAGNAKVQCGPMRMEEVGGRCGGETWTHGETEVQSLQRDPSTTAVVASSTDDDGAGGEKTIQALASWVRWRSKEVEPLGVEFDHARVGKKKEKKKKK